MLGSAAVVDAGTFYRHSPEAAARRGRRAVLLVGPDARNPPPTLPNGVLAVEDAPFSALLLRAAAVVHQGGVGTTAWAMRAGRPMPVVPHAHDRPDNAARAGRLGITHSVGRRHYTPSRAAAELGRLLDNRAYARRAASIGNRVRREDGVRAARDPLGVAASFGR